MTDNMMRSSLNQSINKAAPILGNNQSAYIPLQPIPFWIRPELSEEQQAEFNKCKLQYDLNIKLCYVTHNTHIPSCERDAFIKFMKCERDFMAKAYK